MTVTLVEEYNPLWPVWFEQLKARLAGALHSVPHTIEHVGSTAVPGMTAKPIIDINIVCEAGSFPVIKNCLMTIGYLHQGDKGIPGREAFDLSDADMKSSLPPHHLYVCDKGNQALLEHLAFRNFMRQHPEWRQRLSEHKRHLCEKYNNDRQAYIDGKDAMIREITRLALGNSQ